MYTIWGWESESYLSHALKTYDFRNVDRTYALREFHTLSLDIEFFLSFKFFCLFSLSFVSFLFFFLFHFYNFVSLLNNSTTYMRYDIRWSYRKCESLHVCANHSFVFFFFFGFVLFFLFVCRFLPSFSLSNRNYY